MYSETTLARMLLENREKLLKMRKEKGCDLDYVIRCSVDQTILSYDFITWLRDGKSQTEGMRIHDKIMELSGELKKWESKESDG